MNITTTVLETNLALTSLATGWLITNCGTVERQGVCNIVLGARLQFSPNLSLQRSPNSWHSKPNQKTLQPANNIEHFASTWALTQISKWKKTSQLTAKHILWADNHTVIVQAWLWNTCTAETGNRTNKPLFMHRASHNEVSIIPTALSLTQWKGPQAVVKQLSVCHIAEYSVTGLIAHLIQADVVGISRCSAWIMRHYQLRELFVCRIVFSCISARQWNLCFSNSVKMCFSASTCHLSIVICTEVNRQVMGWERI